MKIICEILTEYKDGDTAEHILKSLQVDDVDFVHSTVQNTQLRATITSTSIPSLIHTLDDYLSCLSVAEKIVDKN